MKEDIYQINQKNDMKDILRLTICGITYPDKSYEIFRTRSNTACIEYVEQGTGTVQVNNKVFHPVEGDSYFIYQGQKHHYYSDKENPWKKYFINLSGSLIESFTEGYRIKDIYHFQGLNLKKELCEIIELSKNPENDSTEEIICILNTIFIKMHNHIKEKSSASQIAEEMKNYLSIHSSGKFKIEDLCRHISKSESQTIRIFKNAYGITPYAYVLNKKISLAKNMLLNTNLSVKEIAYKLCFADEYYFSNIFKSKTGMSPTRFRKTRT